MNKQILLLSFFWFLIQSCTVKPIAENQTVQNQPPQPVADTTITPGAHRTQSYFPLLKGKTLGLVVNPSSLIGKVHLVDSLFESGFQISTIFSPEHGFRGNHEAGAEVDDTIDPETQIKIVSLYGVNKKPSNAQLKNIDLMIFDIQDVGVRCYTYISTLHYVMEACAENQTPLIVLDRPNPNSNYVDGPVLNQKYASFVGKHSIPLVYGLTIGELAKMINGEGWLRDSVKCELILVNIANYTHDRKYSLPRRPSPNLPNDLSIALYPSLCIFEGTIVSVGRGTEKPFQYIGHPNFEGGNWEFTPQSIKGVSDNPPYEGKICRGFDLSASGILKVDQIDWSIIIEMYAGLKKQDKFFNNFFTNLIGNKKIQQIISDNEDPMKTQTLIVESYKEELAEFKKLRSQYLVY